MKIFLSFLLLLLNISTINAQNKLNIIPQPQEVKYNSGLYQLKSNIIIAYNNEADKFAAEQIQQSLQSLSITSNLKKGNDGDIILSSNSNKNISAKYKDESYFLNINSKNITIEAASSKGVFYAVMSLIQLIDKADSKTLPMVEVYDFPDMSIRGISDDISRGQVSTLDNFKKIITLMARYKMNTFMPYIEDMIEFDAYPTIGKNRGALTKAEVKELVSFAKNYFVEIIPVFQTLGHYENILSQDEFVKYGEFTGAASLDVSNDSTYIFLETMLKEVFELFPSEYFHMGADESYDVGLGNSKHLVDQSDLATVHANHYKRIYDICKKHGKKVIMYGDIILSHQSILKQIPKDIMIADWHYGVSPFYESTKTFKDAGFEYYVSPSVWNFLTTFPSNTVAIPNIKYITESGLINNAKGMINSNWGDHGSETIKELLYFGYAWGAQVSWSYNKSDVNKFSNDFFYDFFGVNDKRFTNLYRDMSVTLNQMLWHEVWRHPLYKYREGGWWEPRMNQVAKASYMEWITPSLLEDLKELKSAAKRNNDHLDIIEMLVNLNDWYKQKAELQYKLHLAMKGESYFSDKEIIKSLDELSAKMKNSKAYYSSIWKRYYKPDNLNMIEAKFDRQIQYYDEIKKAINNNTLINYQPEIESKWIYVVSKDTTLADKAEFVKTFTLNKIPDEAMLQLLGENHVKLYVNGKYVDRIIARRSLSLLVTNKMIKMIDIKPYLKTGENEIRIEAESFGRRYSAGTNVYAYFRTGNDVEKILSDDTWKGKPSNGDWKSVRVKDGVFNYTNPNFETKRTSWIEQ